MVDGTTPLIDTSIHVTNHAKKRFKRRVGLPKAACQKHAEKAYTHGVTHAETRGRSKRYLTRIFLQHRNANQLRVYGQFVYVFNNTVLITIMHLPKTVRAGCLRKC